jgi:hypothetical protein
LYEEKEREGEADGRKVKGGQLKRTGKLADNQLDESKYTKGRQTWRQYTVL